MLRLTKKVDYGLIAIYHIASCNIEMIVNTKTISGLFNIPVEHLAKVLQKLAKNGLVQSQNGPKGGYSLAKKLSDISIGEVFTAIEGPIEMTNCHNGEAFCKQFSRCNIRTPLLKIQERIVLFLNQTTLDQLHSPSFQAPSFPTHRAVS